MADLAETAAAYRPRHIAALDGVRGVAVLIVFSFHYAGGTHSSSRPLRLFGLLNKGGWSGVVLFFVLSGFLITGILWDSFEDPHWWRKFFARRSLRIFPLYYLALALVLLGALVEHTGAAALHRLWVPALFLEDLPRFGDIADNIPSPLGIFHLWSIAVEEQFYLLWPWLLFLFARRRTPADREHARALCLVLFLLSFSFRVFIWYTHADAVAYTHHILTQAGALAGGGWLALAYRGPEWPRVLRAAPVVAALGLLGFLAVGVRSHDFGSGSRLMMTVGLPAVTLFFFGLIAAALRDGLVARLFSLRWLRWLGGISYGVYVFHMLLLNVFAGAEGILVGHKGLMLRNLVLLLLAASGSLLAALLSWNLFEKPVLRLKRYFIPSV